MASSSKKFEPETEEERQARKRVITEGTTFGGSRNQYAGREIMMNRDGSNGFTFSEGFGTDQDPTHQYKWNEKTGDYRSHGGGILSIGEVAAPQSEGGGGSPQAVPQQQQGYVDYGNGGNTMSGGSETIINRQPMQDWRPTARNSNGGGVYNPLVNPTNWMVDIAPTPIRNTGIYVKPNKLSYNGGLLNGFID
jgi:hypothetical protein